MVGFLSITSLAIALAVVVVIGTWAVSEFSFDRFHKDGDKMYRLCANFNMNGERMSYGSTYAPVGRMAQTACPEIESMCRVMPQNSMVKTEKGEHSGIEWVMADTNFFTFFTFPLKMGDPVNCLNAPDKVVIDETVALRCFPGEDPIGKNLLVYGENLTVSAVMYDIPRNSHLRGGMVTCFLGVWAVFGMGECTSYITYCKIPDSKMLAGVERKVTDIVNEAIPELKPLNFTYFLESLEDIHFSDDCRLESVVKGNKSLVVVLLLVTFVILLIACINFINLFISTSFLRLRAVGVKKTHGASRWWLMKEFYAETFYYVLAAVVLGVMIALLALPVFNQIMNEKVGIDFSNPVLYLFLGGVLCLVIFLTGTFPALYMTKFNAISTLKGVFAGKNVSFFQKGLIVIQFTVSIIILISVFFINKQVDFMISKDLGFDKGNILYVYDNGGMIANYESFRTELTRNPAITDITAAMNLPTDITQTSIVGKGGNSQELLLEFCHVKPNYFDLLGMDVVAGESFRDDGNNDVCILNETAVKMLGFTDPIGEKLNANGHDVVIKGVVKDAQTKSLLQQVDPQIYFKFSENSGFILFKVRGDFQQVIGEIKQKWSDLNPDVQFQYGFLDEKYEQLYRGEMKIGQMLMIAMVIVFLISIAGLFAMAYYATQRRLKEVGIRKVNGATIGGLLFMLNRDFFLWVGIAFLVACPVAYWLVALWLENYVEHTQISWWVFAMAGIITFAVTLATVSYQTWLAAMTNPVKTLRND